MIKEWDLAEHGHPWLEIISKKKENENEFYKAIDNLFFDPKYDRFKKAETFNAQSAQYGDYTTKEFYNYIPNVVSYEENYEKFKNYSKTKLKNMLSIQPNKYLSSKTHMAKALAISNLTENKSITHHSSPVWM